MTTSVIKLKANTLDKSVHKANELIEASYRLSLQEQRLLAVMISMIHRDHESFQPYRVDLKDFAKIVGFKGGSFSKEAIKITERLEQRVLTIKDRGKDTLLQIGWVSSIEYFNKSGQVEFCIDPKLKPYLLELQEAYKGYALLNALRLRSSYSFRLYELLKQFEKIGERRFFLSDLRSILSLKENEYKLFGDFKRRILESSVKEINKITDLKIDYETRKQGRKVSMIIFSINKNNQNKELEPPAVKLKNSKLYNRLVHKFCQTNKQALEYIEEYPEYQLRLNLEHVERRYKRGEVKDIGAYTHKAITSNIADKRSLFDVEMTENHEKEKLKKKNEEIQDRLESEYSDYKKEEAEEYRKMLSLVEFQTIEESIINQVREEFGVNNPGVNNMIKIELFKRLFDLSGGLSFEEFCENRK